ncbi:hypothetical protein G9A89_010971 [Geosiphon pyriformis]|nr:hypothetical protein G9A89_010971 [Geosiphon pyriformis]
MATRPEFQPPVATSKKPVPTKDLSLNLRKIQHYQPSKPISSLGLMTKEQDYQPYQCGPAKKDPNETRTTTNNYAPLNKSKNNTSPKSILISAKTVLSRAKINERNLERKMEIENQQSQNQLINQQNSSNGPKSEKFVAYTDLEQVIDIQYFDNGHLGIILERVHPTDAKFDLCYPEDQSTTLAKKRISIQGGVIDFGYTGNLMVLLQNNSKKPYTIESKEKIVQAIFLPLVKIGKFVPVENHKELLQTTRGTFGFGLTEKGIEENFAETIKKKDEIKILIANTTEEPVYILEDTIIGYFGIELENASTPQEILNFSEITFYCELTSINWQQPLECYQFTPEKLAKLNIRTMDPDQQ